MLCNFGLLNMREKDLLKITLHIITKLMTDLRRKAYRDTIEMLGWTTLKTSRLLGWLVKTSKIIRQFDSVNPHYFLKLLVILNLDEAPKIWNIRKKIYQRIIQKILFTNLFKANLNEFKEWNNLPTYVPNGTPINIF